MFLHKLLNHFKARTYTSKVNEPIRIGRSFGKKAIFAGSIPQSGGEFLHEWDTVIKSVKEKGYELQNCLMLGVAGGSAINSLRKFYPQIHILGIEIDPVMLKVALKNNLFKTDNKTKLKIADGIVWVRQDKNTYDLIIVDLYLGDKNVTSAREHPFLRQVKTCLTPEGIVLYSCHYTKGKRGEYRNFIRNLREIFTRTEVVFEFPKKKVLLLEKSICADGQRRYSNFLDEF